MFGTLLESRPSRPRRRGSAALSAVVHLTITATAVAATLPSGPKVDPPRVHPDTVVWIDPGRPVAPERPAAHPSPARCDFCIPTPPLPSFPEHPLPLPGNPGVDIVIDAPSSQSDFGTSARSGPLVDNPLAHGEGVGSGTGIFTPNQVERAVAVLGTVRPTYPETLRAAGIEGRVVVRFVVDTTGHVEPGSITIVESTHARFEQSVRDVLPRLRFAPAEVGGRHVRQLVEMPFQFSLSNR